MIREVKRLLCWLGIHSFDVKLLESKPYYVCNHCEAVAALLTFDYSKKPNQVPRAETVYPSKQTPTGLQLVRDQAVTVSMSGSDVCLQCDNAEDANAVFEWVLSIAAKENV